MHHDDAPTPPPPCWPNKDGKVITPKGFEIEKDALVKVLLQSLSELGFSQSVSVLEKESGTQLETPLIASLGSGVLQGEWDRVEQVLPKLGLPPSATNKMACWIYEQQYLELLEEENTSKALEVLQGHIAPKHRNQKRVLQLSTLLMFTEVSDLKNEIGWNGIGGGTRQQLLQKLQTLIPSSMLLPAGRLMTLLDGSLQHQISSCKFHQSQRKTMCLLEDHQCSLHPDYCTWRTLLGHTDEVLCVAFSHDGSSLASASKDQTIKIWSMDTLGSHQDLRRTLRGNTDTMCFVSWSNNDRYLLALCGTREAKVWDLTDQACESKLTVSGHHDDITSVAWLPDEAGFLTSGADSRIILWSLAGDLLHEWGGILCRDVGVSRALNCMVAAGINQKLVFIDLESMLVEEKSANTATPINSLCLSRDGNFGLVRTEQGLQLWDLQTKQLVRVFAGAKQTIYVLRACFGGADENLVASGSEDCKLYIWHRHTGEALFALPGHSGVVNSISWSPQDDTMFASASDDHTIRIWRPANTGSA